VKGALQDGRIRADVALEEGCELGDDRPIGLPTARRHARRLGSPGMADDAPRIEVRLIGEDRDSQGHGAGCGEDREIRQLSIEATVACGHDLPPWNCSAGTSRRDVTRP
jgi:hypothetical protein